MHGQTYNSDHAQTRLFAVFDQLEGTADWKNLKDKSSNDLGEDYQ